MIAYVFVLLTATALSLIADKNVINYRFCIVVSIFLLSALAGLRAYSVGTDTAMYVRAFYNIAIGGNSRFEPGFYLTVKGIMTASQSPTAVFFVFSLATNALFIYRFWELRNNCSYSLMVLLFLSLYYPETFNTFRQCFAIALIFFATRYLEKNKISFYVAMVLVAASFHTSAFLALFSAAVHFCFEKQTRNVKTLAMLAFPVIAIGLYFAASYLFQIYSGYTSEYGEEKLGVVVYLRFAAISILFAAALLDKKRGVNKIACSISPYWKAVFVLYTLGTVLTFVSLRYQWAGRGALYFKVMEIPSIGYSLKKYSLGKIVVCIYVILCAWSVYRVLVLGQADIIPYSVVQLW